MPKPIYFFPSLAVTLSAVILPLLTLASVGVVVEMFTKSNGVSWHLQYLSIVFVACNLLCTIAIFRRSGSPTLATLREFCIGYLGLLLAAVLVLWLMDIGSPTLDLPPFALSVPLIAISFVGMYFARRYQPIPKNHCWHCRYDLRGSDSLRCPECGKPR
ncbi:MAG: hypothetical protein O7G85_17015 [Planctomycetota bacterium]|nr:hypothetical protein [Planctomycetota bacterium]